MTEPYDEPVMRFTPACRNCTHPLGWHFRVHGSCLECCCTEGVAP